ncbi:MAG: prephenate dehydratase [Candidatus Omnitrophica bacterium]|nr:prephenate dehydratase [Candidatus Omnitrophota bacterium]
MNKEINHIRGKIDRIDGEILRILNERASLTEQITHIKKNSRLSFYDPAREKIIIENLKKINTGPLKDNDVEEAVSTIIKICRNLVRPLRAAYLGPEATFSHLAAIETFGKQSETLSARNIQEVFNLVEKEIVDYGIVPIENSIEGIVTHTIDMFIDSELKIIAENLLRVHLYLLSEEKNVKKIKKIFSLSQPLAQCRLYIREKFPDVEIVETESTGAAAKKIKQIKGSAAIASKAAADLYGLNILDEKIEDNPQNFTRFLVISREFGKETGNDKTSILFTIKDRPGALHDMLVPFKTYGINLTKIESRPTKKKPWEYIFFVDFEGYFTQPDVQNALKELEEKAIFIKILGSYPKEY